MLAESSIKVYNTCVPVAMRNKEKVYKKRSQKGPERPTSAESQGFR